MFENHPIAYLPKRPGEADHTNADISISRTRLGYRPTKSLEEYVKEFLLKN